MIIVYSTFPSKEQALDVCRKLLEEKLIACFNVFPVNSGYWWQGKIAEDNEFSVILKTTKLKEKEVFQRIRELHPYFVPAIFSIEVREVDKDYKQWLEETMKKT
ncbi:divalent-cation tolerance protein CutA [Pseudothermotoga sp. U03pept]|uniref:divalent-cation tolerance protein CutA n=1 Tax=Pseudothermotoga sp. U03pept TaxID=3447012 RepID=UPI003F0A5BF8